MKTEHTEIQITEAMRMRAMEEARSRAPYTSRRHDYHNGSEPARIAKFYGGCLGEEVFREWLRSKGMSFGHRVGRSPKEPDRGPDIWIRRDGKSYSVNVKTELPGRKRFVDTLLVTVEETRKRPCDLYAAVRLLSERGEFVAGEVVGLVSLEQVKAAEVVKGFQESYAVPAKSLYCLCDCIKHKRTDQYAYR